MFNSFFFSFQFCVELWLKVEEPRGGMKEDRLFLAGFQGFNFQSK